MDPVAEGTLVPHIEILDSEVDTLAATVPSSPWDRERETSAGGLTRFGEMRTRRPSLLAKAPARR